MSSFAPVPRESLGLQTDPEFELELLEEAVKGNKVFERYYEEHIDGWDINMQLLWHEMSLDVEQSKANNFHPILKRVRNVVVELKFGEHKLHQRAAKIYLQFLEMERLEKELSSRAEDMKEVDVLGSWNAREGEPDYEHYELGDELLPAATAEGVPYMIRGDNVDDWAQADGLDIMNLEKQLDSRLAKWTLEDIDSSTQIVQEEPPSAELQNSETTVGHLEITIGALSDNELSIIDKPTETDDGSIFGKPKATNDDSGTLSLSVLTLPASNEEVRVSEPRESKFRLSESKPRDSESGQSESGLGFSMDSVDRLQLGLPDIFSKLDNKLRKNAKKSASKYSLDEKVEQANEHTDYVDPHWQNNSNSNASRTVALEKFPGDFKGPIEWSLGETSYSAMNIEDLRSRHDVIIEGAFRKRNRRCIWHSHHGFVLYIGVMVYFRKEKNEMVFKKVADFRNCRVNVLNKKSLKIICKDRDFQLQFSKPRNCDIWYETIMGFSARLLTKSKFST